MLYLKNKGSFNYYYYLHPEVTPCLNPLLYNVLTALITFCNLKLDIWVARWILNKINACGPRLQSFLRNYQHDFNYCSTDGLATCSSKGVSCDPHSSSQP